MNEMSGVFMAGTVIAIFLVVAILVLWRIRKHAAGREDAEARMSAAMQELQLLAAKLKAEKEKLAAEKMSSDDRHDAPSST